MKTQANLIRPGWIIEFNNRQWTVLKTQITKPGKGGAFIQVEMRDLNTGSKTNERFRTVDDVEKLTSEDYDCQFLYRDGDKLYFMNKDTYDQFELSVSFLEESAAYLQDNMDVIVNFVEGKPVGVTLPTHVVLEVKETEPYIKGQTVTTSYKPAIMDNGVRVMIPPFVTTGEKIVVSTVDSTYVERAK
ncbi:MAG: elongation factor P [Lactobacillales bacterium]|jgi:elongation factor P|nr:elongation factor P [Lactobacillales bacterium]